MLYIATILTMLLSLMCFSMQDHDLLNAWHKIKFQDYVLLQDGAGHARVTFNPADRLAYLMAYAHNGKKLDKAKKISLEHPTIALTNFKSLGIALFSPKEFLLGFLAQADKEDDTCILTFFHRLEGQKKIIFIPSSGRIISLLSIMYDEQQFRIKMLEKQNILYIESEIAVSPLQVSFPKLLRKYFPLT